MLKLRSLTKSFAGRRALDALSLEVHPGEVVGLLGPNGAGKSTTVSIAIGALKPDTGEATINNISTSTHPARAHLGIAPQSLAIYPELTAKENLLFFAGLYNIKRTRAQERALHLAKAVGLEARLNDKTATFSGGMARRLHLACAMMHNPKVLILDEPTANVDPQSRLVLFDLIRNVADEGTAVLFTTHYMDEAQRLCDRVAIVDHGKIIAQGTVDHLINTHGGGHTIHIDHKDTPPTQHSSTNPAADLPALLEKASATSVRVDAPDLEAVFFSLTGRSLRDQ